MAEYLSLFNRIYEDIEDKVTDIFLKYQEELDIEQGLVTPGQLFELDEAQSTLANIIKDILDYEKDSQEER